MKLRSTAAIVKSMKAKKKKVAYKQAARAIGKKIEEIKKDSRSGYMAHANMPLFRASL